MAPPLNAQGGNRAVTTYVGGTQHNPAVATTAVATAETPADAQAHKAAEASKIMNHVPTAVINQAAGSSGTEPQPQVKAAMTTPVASTSAATSNPKLSEMLRNQLDDKLVAAGRVVAIVRGKSVQIATVAATAVTSPTTLFVERVRNAPQRTELPAVLAANLSLPKTATATLLSHEIVTANASGTGIIRARVYAHDSSGLLYAGTRNRATQWVHFEFGQARL